MTRPAIHPGEILADELAEIGVSPTELARQLQVPANRIGSHTFNAAQLKTIQEIITLVVFSGFSIWYLKQDIKWNYAVGFFFMVVAAFFIFKKW